MKITATARPFTLTFHATGTSYPLTSDQAQRLLDEYPAVKATRNRVILPGHNTSKASERVSITPATVGGGPAFIITPDASVSRPIHEIAAEIRRVWPRPYFGAVPYLDAMRHLTKVEDNYYADSGRSVVLYFLANAQTWRGPDARRIKAELNAMLKRDER